jgi:hypothetical protein
MQDYEIDVNLTGWRSLQEKTTAEAHFKRTTRAVSYYEQREVISRVRKTLILLNELVQVIQLLFFRLAFVFIETPSESI